MMRKPARLVVCVRKCGEEVPSTSTPRLAENKEENRATCQNVQHAHLEGQPMDVVDVRDRN